MKLFFTAALFISNILLMNNSFAQTNALDETILSKPWNAYWIDAKNETGREAPPVCKMKDQFCNGNHSLIFIPALSNK